MFLIVAEGDQRYSVGLERARASETLRRLSMLQPLAEGEQQSTVRYVRRFQRRVIRLSSSQGCVHWRSLTLRYNVGRLWRQNKNRVR